MPTSQVNGIRIYWEINGDVGDPMVLVHGSWGDHQNWAAAVPALSRSFRVLTYDRRGQSRSERPAGQGSVRDDVADLAALLVELRHSPAHVVGNSFGASIVLRLAAERPELFRSLIVHEPPLFGLLNDEPNAKHALAAVQERMSAVISLLTAGDWTEGAVFAGVVLILVLLAGRAEIDVSPQLGCAASRDIRQRPPVRGEHPVLIVGKVFGPVAADDVCQLEHGRCD